MTGDQWVNGIVWSFEPRQAFFDSMDTLIGNKNTYSTPRVELKPIGYKLYFLAKSEYGSWKQLNALDALGLWNFSQNITQVRI